MAIRETFAALDQPDVASLVMSGILYRCYVYRRRAQQTSGTWSAPGQSYLEAVCYAEMEDGQDVLVFHNVIRTGDLGAGNVIDSPRIVPRGNFFIVHWVEGRSASAAIWKAWIEIANLHNTPTWTVVGTTIACSVSGLFDISTIEGNSTGDYILAYKHSADDQFQVRRQKSHLTHPSADETWNVGVAVNIDNRVLACYANETDNDVVISYEPLTGEGGGAETLWSSRIDVDDGLNHANAQTISYSGRYTAVGHCRTASRRCAVVAELQPADYATNPADVDAFGGARAYQRRIAYVSLNTGTAAPVANQHAVYNLTMLSRPWAYASHDVTGAEPNVYVAVGFKSLRDGAGDSGGSEWSQAYGYVVNLDNQLWTGTATTVRPRPAAKMIAGDMDSRSCSAIAFAGGPSPIPDMIGERRMNHLSHVSAAPLSGPDLKTRTYAAITWGHAHTRSDDPGEIFPAGATVTGFRYHMEEPWVMHRNVLTGTATADLDPAQPSTNVKTTYPWSNHQGVQVGRDLVMSGGVPSVYDGKQLVEWNFLWAPEIDVDTDAGPGLAAGTYSYFAIYEWRSPRTGQLHRSSPSNVVQITVADPNFVVQLYARTMTISLKDSIRYGTTQIEDIAIVFYRTQAGGTTYHRLWGSADDGGPTGFELANTPVNDPRVWFIEASAGDTVVDSTLILHDLAPWQLVQGVWLPMEPWQPPASGPIAKWRNRVWLALSETDGEIWYSLEIGAEPGGIATLVPEFNPANSFRVDDLGTVTGLVPMDSGLVVFTRDTICLLSGEVNDDAGAGQSLHIQLVHRGTGCIEPRSIVHTRDGVVFQSERGLCLLDRGLQIYPEFGDPIEDTVALAGNIRRSTYCDSKRQLRLIMNESVTSGGVVMVYDLEAKQWSKFLPQDLASNAWGAALHDGGEWRGARGETLHYILAQRGLGYERPADDATVYADQNDASTNVAVPLNVRTGWLQPQDVGGFGRVWEIGVLLSRPNSSEITVTLEYERTGDFASATTQAIVFAAGTNPYLRVKPNVTKIGSDRIRVAETGTVALTENIAVHAIVFHGGTSGRMRKVPDTFMGS